MDLVNTTPFQFAYILNKVSFPRYSLTLIVKATFLLARNHQVKILEDQPFPTGNEFFPDDPDMQGSLRYPSDFALFKPRSDIMFVGKAYAPLSRKVTNLKVRFSVGGISKSLFVHGTQYSKKTPLDSTTTEPEYFTKIDLRYENSFGGKNYPQNPVGKAHDALSNPSFKGSFLLPNILHSKDSSTASTIDLGPPGFGPIRDTWIQRSSLTGTYDDDYLNNRWPWHPHDFNWAYYNVAPRDMQLDGYLQGDENLYFENLHPKHSKFQSQLPGLKIRCFANEQKPDDSEESLFTEIKMNLDTLCVDMEDEKVSLVWRGIMNNVSEEFEEVKNLFILSEPLESPIHNIDHYKSLFSQAVKDSEAIWQGKTNEKKEASGPEAVHQENTDEDMSEAEIDALMENANKKMRLSLIEAGIDPDNLPQQHKTDFLKEQERKAFFQHTEESADNEKLTVQMVRKKLENRTSLAGADLTGLDLSSLDMTGQDLRDALLKGTILHHSNLCGSNLMGANLVGADFSHANLTDTNLTDADANTANFSKANFSKAILLNAIFEKATITNANLNECQANDALFLEADLSGSNFQNATITYGDFSKANIEKCNFSGSDLSNANFTQVNGTGVTMIRTIMNGTRISDGCDFRQSDFRGIEAKESLWEEAQLDEANFSYAKLKGADFSNASLRNVNFSHANLKLAKFTSADLRTANCQGIGLFRGSLENANLEGSDFNGSNLYGVEFYNAKITGAHFGNANLKMTKLEKQIRL